DKAAIRPSPSHRVQVPTIRRLSFNAALSGRGERMRASGSLQREVRRLFGLLGDEHAACVAPVYSITLSVRTRMDWGIVIPSTFAVFRLTTSSTVLGCST